MHHKRHRPRAQRAGCWCKAEKKFGIRALRGGKVYKGQHGARERRLQVSAFEGE